MSKLKSKSSVIEWYWPDFLEYCLKTGKNIFKDDSRLKLDRSQAVRPTEDNFWLWYITDGPLGVKEAGRYYTKTDIEYI